MKTRFIPATEFKAKCLALLDEVQREGSSITVTKRGRPVATITPAKNGVKSYLGILADKFDGKAFEDIDSMDFSDLYEPDPLV